MSNEELKTIEEIKQLANIIDVSAKELQTGLRNFLIAKEYREFVCINGVSCKLQWKSRLT